jgi:hypothetical protein
VTAAGADAGPDTEDALRREGERIAELLDDVGNLAAAPVRTRVEELVQRLVHLYGAGLRRLLDLAGAARDDPAFRAALAADALLSSLLVLHDLHPDAAAAASYDPGPAPAHAPPREPARLFQIDLARSRAARGENAP